MDCNERRWQRCHLDGDRNHELWLNAVTTDGSGGDRLYQLSKDAATGVGNVWLAHVGHDTRPWRRTGAYRREPIAAAVEPGDELGAFLLGSTVVMVLPPGAPRLDLPAVGASVRCGAALTAHEGP